MNPARLLQHFDRIAEAPDAIPRLRRFILDLAVRGKLVEQDPNDEPAAELLKRIQVEKARLVKEEKIKKEPISFHEEDELFSLPVSWSWARFIEVAAIESNLVKPESFPDHPHIAPDNIESRTGRLLDYQTIRESQVFSAKHRFFPGHIVYSKIRPNLAKAALVGIEGLCSADMYPIRPFIDRVFLLKFMLSDTFVQQSIKEDNRVAMPKINQESLSRILVAVPPLAEQHRIVAKVDELMTLCDQLEAAKTEREQSRDRLVAASLHHLNQPADAEEANTLEAFRDHACFYFNHLPHLTTRPEHIKQLRQTILNLAVRGKLVPQDPNDEPAAELFGFILAGRSEGETPFLIPNSWAWMTVGEIAQTRLGKMLDKAKNKGKPHRYLRNVNVRWFDFDLSDVLEMRFEDFELEEFALRLGDVLICEGGEPGRAAVWDERDSNIYFQKAIHRVRFPRGVNPYYFVNVLREAANSGRLDDYFTGVGIKHFTGKGLSSFLVPLPPLAEQHRIVAKVDELMALCDQLEAQLTTTEGDSRRLLEAVLHEALSPALEEAA